MSTDRPKPDSMSIEEVTVSNMSESAAFVGALERKDFHTNQNLYDITAEFRRKHPRTNIPKIVFPDPYLLTETNKKSKDQVIAKQNPI